MASSTSSSSSLLLFLAVTSMGLAAVAGQGIMSIYNDFPSKLSVAYNSDREQQPVDMVPAQKAHRFTFNPDVDRVWVCTLKTTPMTGYPYTPVPGLHGQFAVYVRDPAFRACYPVSDWKVNVEGLWLVVHPGERPTHIYSWPQQ